MYSIDKSVEEPILRWKRNKFTVTSLVTQTNSDGETVICVSNGKLKKKNQTKKLI